MCGHAVQDAPMDGLCPRSVDFFKATTPARVTLYRLDKIAPASNLAVPVSAAAAANVPVIVSDQDAILVGTIFRRRRLAR